MGSRGLGPFTLFPSMGVSSEIYRAAIGVFGFFLCISSCSVFAFSMLSSVVLFLLISSLSMLLLIFGSVHPNPGPFNLNLSVAYLKARSLNVDGKFREISVLASLHEFDLFAFLETWLTSSIFNGLFCYGL